MGGYQQGPSSTWPRVIWNRGRLNTDQKVLNIQQKITDVLLVVNLCDVLDCNETTNGKYTGEIGFVWKEPYSCWCHNIPSFIFHFVFEW